MTKEEAQLDAFIDADIVEGRRVRRFEFSPHRTFLFVASLFALAWLASDWVDELQYHFSGAELVDLGEIMDLPDVELPLTGYAQISGVLGNKAATISGLMRPNSLRGGPVQIRQVIGAPLYIEFDQDKHLDDYAPFKTVTVKGRLTDFGPASELKPVHRYLRESLGVELTHKSRLLILDEVPGEMWRYPIALLLLLLLAGVSCMLFYRGSIHTEIHKARTS